MKSFIKIFFLTLATATVVTSCTKDETANTAANEGLTGASTFSLNNRVLAGFIVDGTSLPTVDAGNYPASYNKFRKLLTYDTVSITNKPTVYNVGDVVNVVGYFKGDDSAIAKRRINFRFFQPPTSFITPTALFVMQRAEDSYRGFAPATADILSTSSLATIAATNVAPYNVAIVANEKVNGINYNTYLVSLAYIIPATFSGKLISVNLTANTAGSATDLGNVNWNYAFRVR